MPVDVAKAKSAPPTKSEGSWKKNDVILYHLGIGAGMGAPPTRRSSSTPTRRT